MFRYHPFYCEENIWWLCAEPALGPGPHRVVFIAAPHGACPIAAQRAGGADGLVCWDYHCICLDGSGRIWDLDSRLPLALAAGDWLAASFPFADQLGAGSRPRFRVIDAQAYRRDFASDRSHMRTADGGWLHPPPPWPPIGTGMNLPAYRDVGTAAGPGRCFDLAGFRALAAEAAG
ncbi:MAG: hypothetical protein GVY22_11320 [Gammaproteobacteria bacterium]|jgi:hypothetical protein|nr:hypothetical protein [Gammaproteobacteria bacterium]